MELPPTLTTAEVCALTGKQEPTAQARALIAMHIKYAITVDGPLFVARADTITRTARPQLPLL